jgi:hypothetical protein
LAQRSRKRRAGSRPAARGAADTPPDHAPNTTTTAERSDWYHPSDADLTRSQRRDAEARAALTPLAPGERPAAIVLCAAVAAVLALANLIAFLAGAKIGGKHPAAAGIMIFSAVMAACAVGLWRMWYGAVLGFMALLAIIATVFALLLIEASNVLGVVVALAVIGIAGYLFFKLVRVLSRIQMPRAPGR